MKTMTKHDKMYQEIENHGENLNAIFHTGLGNIELCKKLHRLEVKAHRLATDYCNGENGVNSENWDELCKPILKQVIKILGDCPVFLNGDARGYALKISDEYVREHNLTIFKDWGGYGILAPDFNE